MEKKLNEIAWDVSEEVYRQDPALSYSTLAKYEREGFNSLDKLFDKIESPSLTFGSAVDCMITGGDKEFNRNFLVAEINSLSDTLEVIAKLLFEQYGRIYDNIEDIPDDSILLCIKDISWNNHWQAKTRVKKIKEDCSQYYKLLYLTGNRTIINTHVYNDVINVVDKLKSFSSTKFYFEQNSIFDTSIERFYQLKFKSTINNIPFRCMCDELIVLKDKKLIIPIDLKTSSSPEWDFYKSFIKWRYDIQSRLYWKIIRDNLDKDPYFRDFTLANYRFIVINKETLTPLVWSFADTKKEGTLYYGKDNSIELRDPITIGKELKDYLYNKPIVPNFIIVDGVNELKEKLSLL